jgi:dephospho-CoA kinase
LTGSIAMGKSTAASLLRRLKWPVFDADAEVHRLMIPGGVALPAIAAAFPHVVGPKGVDRKALGEAVFGNPVALAKLEAIIHPLVAIARRHFLFEAALNRRPAVVLDVPLLFEGGAVRGCDVIVVTTAPAFLQRQRALARPGMSVNRLKGILARQTPDDIKRRYADVVIQSGLGRRQALRGLSPLRKLVASRLSNQ